MQIEKVCVIGGSGFVGRHLCQQLVAQGYRVRVPTRERERAKPLFLLPTLEVVVADVHNPAALADVVAGCDAVINLVGVLHDGGEQRGFRAAHVELARNVVEACRSNGIKRLLQMSALGAETDGPSDYLRSKGEAERIVMESGLDVTVFRPSVIFGPEDSFLNLFAGLARVLPVLVLARPDARFQPVYVGDVAAAFVFELVGPHVYTLRELVRLAGVYSGHQRPVVGLPEAFARLQAFLLEHMPGGPLMSRDNLDSMKADNIASGRHPLPPDWKPTPLEAVAPDYLRR